MVELIIETIKKAREEGARSRDAEVAALREGLEVSRQIGDTFWDALKPLNLPAINVANPGAHVTELIRERDAARTARDTIAADRDRLWTEARRFEGKYENEKGCNRKELREAKQRAAAAEARLTALTDAAERVVCTAEKVIEVQGDEEVVVGYRHKTGAMHALIGVLRGGGAAPGVEEETRHG